MEDLNSVIKKVQDLFKLTVENGCSLNEAANAANRAQSLITKYRLDVSQLSFTKNDDDISDKHSPLYMGKRIVSWKNQLSFHIANLNGCATVLRPNGVYVSIIVIGRKQDADIVKYLFTYLSREVEQLCDEAMKRGEGVGKTWANSFKHGATSAIIKRLKEAQEDTIKTAETTSIVLLHKNDEKVKEWMKNNLNLRQSKAQKGSGLNYDAYMSGKDAGNQIALNKGLETQNNNKLGK